MDPKSPERDRAAGGLLYEPLEQAAMAHPDRPALLYHDEILTFATLAARTRAVAAAIGRLSEPGHRVAMIGENHPSWVEAYYGVPRAGRVLVFLNHRLAAAELAAIVSRSGASVLVGPAHELDRLRPYADDMAAVRHFVDREDLDGVGEPWPGPATVGGRAADADPVWIIYTSGTTGSPKGAILTHRNFAASLEASAYGRPVGDDDVYLYPFPLCHVSGYNVLRNLAVGRPVVLMERFTPTAFVEAVERHRVTNVSVPATMLSSLLDHLDDHPGDRPRLGSLRAIAYGAAPMPVTLLRRAARELGVDFTQGYGMTELAGNVAFLGPHDHRRGLAGEERLLATAGRPAPTVDVAVVDEEGRSVPTGVAGEIVVRGEQVTPGYFGDEETTRASFSDGWFHTGDIGVVNDEGYLSVVDRKKDVIVTGGENVSSLEVEEEILRSCPEVREVAVVAVHDPHWGENVCAVVVLRPGRTIAAQELARRVRRRLAGFKAPRHVVWVDELPKNATGKIVKHDLRQWLASHPEQVGSRL